MHSTFFLGSNTPFGFVGGYHHLLKDSCTILLGGAGCGKSTLLKKALEVSSEAGYDGEIYLCSSDVESLDALFVPTLNYSIIDGTPPHAVSATSPVIHHNVVNLLDNANKHKVDVHLNDIEKCLLYKKQYFTNAYCNLKCSYELYNNYNKYVLSQIDDSIIQKCVNTISDIIKKSSDIAGSRFVSAITNKGYMDMLDKNYSTLKHIGIDTDNDGIIIEIMHRIASILDSKNINYMSFINPLYNAVDAIKISDFIIAKSSRFLRVDIPYSIDVLCTNSYNDDLSIADKLFNKAIVNLNLAHITHISMEQFFKEAIDWADVNKKTDKILINMFS